MAKQSAKSKGYRKVKQKKPFLTKKEIIELIVIVAAIALVVVLFNVFYDDGFIRAREVQPGDVVSFAARDANGRYRKVADAHDLEGFTQNEPEDPDTPLINHVYTPSEEIDHIEAISLSGSFIPASQQYANASSTSAMSQVTYSEPQTTTVQGHDAYVFSYTFDYYSEDAAAEAEADAPAEDAEAEEVAETEEAAPEAEEAEEAEEPASNSYSQTICLYVDVSDYTICFHVYRTGEDDSFYLPDDQLVDYVLGYANEAFTVCEPTN